MPHSPCCGVLVVKDIGTPPELLEADPHLKIHWIEPAEFRGLPLVRDPVANKGTYGHALVVAGSLGKSGAAILAARGALRSGAGLVTVATPQDVLPTVAGGLPEMMTAPLGSTDAGTASLRSLDYGRFAEIMRGKSVLAIGPGLPCITKRNNSSAWLGRAGGELPIILDADGLNAYDGMADTLNERHSAAMVMTPHPGEMARFCLGITVKGSAGAPAGRRARSGGTLARACDPQRLSYHFGDAPRERVHQHDRESRNGLSPGEPATRSPESSPA